MTDTSAAGNANAPHIAWIQKRDAAIADLMSERQADLVNWFKAADAAETPEEDNRGAVLVQMATVVADCAGAHAAAADGYFRLAQSMHSGREPDPVARRWYTQSLVHAEKAGWDFGAARSAYCLGAIDEAESRADDALGHFTQAHEHAERAGIPAAKAAALFRLAQLAMAKLQFDVALEQSLQSYVASRAAKQYLPGAETLTRLFKFLAGYGFDSLAEKPGLDLLSQAVVSLSEKADDARPFAAAALRALAPLNDETRTAILRGIAERYGAEVSGALSRELDGIVAVLRKS
jgi:hypothetical protein